jgi:hypothetical protein
MQKHAKSNLHYAVLGLADNVVEEGMLQSMEIVVAITITVPDN